MKDRVCIPVDLNLDDNNLAELIHAYVASNLCQCTKEKFDVEYDKAEGSDLERSKHALWQAVVNEMVLRKLAEKIADEKKND